MSTKVGTRKCICQLCSCGNHRCPIHGTDSPFNRGNERLGKTEYGETFIPKDWERSKPIRPGGDHLGNSGDLDTTTTNAADYLPHDHPGRSKSFKPNQEAFRSDARFDGEGTTKADYGPKRGERGPNYRPNQQYNPSGDPFDGDTTNKRDYDAKQGEKSKSYKPGYEYRGPDGKFEDDTTNRADYYTKKGERQRGYKPAEDSLRPEGDMEGNTGYRDDFQPKEFSKNEKFRQRDQYQPPSGKLDGTTTYKDGYIGEGGERSTPFKPLREAYRSDQPFQGNSTYKGDFYDKPLEDRGHLCKAELAEKNRLRGYRKTNDEMGHRFFEKYGGSAQSGGRRRQ